MIACVLAACAPVVDGPADRARATDLADSDRLAATLATLPSVISARATLRHAFRDPLNGTTSPASASVLVVVDGDVESTRAQAAALVHATAPDIASPVVLVVPGSPRPVLAQVGPFTVERRSRTPLVATLAVGLAVIAALAIALARKSRS